MHSYHMIPSTVAIRFICSTKRRWHQSERKKDAVTCARAHHVPASTTVADGVPAESQKQKTAMPLELPARPVVTGSETAKQQPAVTVELTAPVTVKRKSEPKLNTTKDMILLRRMTIMLYLRARVIIKITMVFVLQLVSTETHTNEDEMKAKLSEKAILNWTKKLKMCARKTSTYNVKFVVDSNFGLPGAIMVSNRDQNEFYLDSINIEGVIILPATLGLNQNAKTLQNESSSLQIR